MKYIKNLTVLCVLLLAFSSTPNWAEEIQIHIHGVSDAVAKNIRNRLAVVKQNYGSDLTAADIQAFYNGMPENIRKAIEPFGYFKSDIHSKLTKKASLWVADITISSGPQLLISQVDVKISGPGKQNPELQKLLQNFPLKSNQPLLIEDYNNALQQLFATANNQGYLKASIVKKEIQINLKKYSAVIVIHMETGPLYYFGEVNFNKSAYAPEFLHRFVSFDNKQAFSSQKLLKFQQDLANTPYFQQVLVNPLFNDAKDYQVPIEVDAIPKKSQQYNVGVGYGTFTGPRFTAGVDWRRATNTGQRFNTQIKISPILSGIAAKYFIPGNNPLTEQYTLGANLQQFIPKNGRSLSEALAASYVKNLDEWQHNLSLNYLRERFSLNDNPWQNSNLLYPSLSISRIKYDTTTNPHSGSAFNFNLQGSSDKFMSQINFLQSEIKGKYIFSPTEPSRVILRGDVGYTVVENLQKLPLTLQFYAGGIDSVRGYRFDSMGPARYLKVGSVEYQHRITGNWNASVFYDAGIASNHFNDPYQHSRGVGVVYNSLIGPVKVYVSRAESTPGRPYRVEFNIGPDF